MLLLSNIFSPPEDRKPTKMFHKQDFTIVRSHTGASSWAYTRLKTNMTMEKQASEDVSPTFDG